MGKTKNAGHTKRGGRGEAGCDRSESSRDVRGERPTGRTCTVYVDNNVTDEDLAAGGCRPAWNHRLDLDAARNGCQGE
jgi:hypothetical protein